MPSLTPFFAYVRRPPSALCAPWSRIFPTGRAVLCVHRLSHILWHAKRSAGTCINYPLHSAPRHHAYASRQDGSRRTPRQTHPRLFSSYSAHIIAPWNIHRLSPAHVVAEMTRTLLLTDYERCVLHAYACPAFTLPMPPCGLTCYHRSMNTRAHEPLWYSGSWILHQLTYLQCVYET